MGIRSTMAGQVDVITIQTPSERLHLPNPVITALQDWQPAGAGTYRPIARLIRRWTPVESRDQYFLGFAIRPRTIKALIANGHIEGVLDRSKRHWINVESFLAFIARRQSDPSYWERVAFEKQITGATPAAELQPHCSATAD